MQPHPATTTAAPPPAGRRECKKREVHRRIRDAALKLLAERGFAATSIDAIAAAANISRPTFFNYFPSKKDLLYALMDQMDADFITYVQDELNRPCPAAEKLRHLFIRSSEFIRETPELATLLITQSLMTAYDLSRSKAHFRNIRHAISKLVADGVRSGEIRRDYPVALMVQILLGSYLSAIFTWIAAADFDLTESLEQTASLLSQSWAADAPWNNA